MVKLSLPEQLGGGTELRTDATDQRRVGPGDVRDTMMAGMASLITARWQLAIRCTLRMFRLPSLTNGPDEAIPFGG